MQNSPKNSKYGIEDEAQNEWTFDENKLFENALATVDLSSPCLFQNIKTVLPWKTLDQIKLHYEKLVEDVEAIEKDRVTSSSYGRVHRSDHQGRRCVPWTEDEHKAFLVGLSKYGKGEWRNISRDYVPSKTSSQVASHGQKYFRRVENCTPVEKRRYSIHDIRILNSSIVETPARHPSNPTFLAQIVHDQPHHPSTSSSSNNSSQSVPPPYDYN